MEDTDKYLSSRRNFIKTGATAAVAGLAGCSGDNGEDGEDTNTSTDTENPTEQPGTEAGNDTTPAENDNSGTETSDGQQTDEQNSGVNSLYEEDESQAEADWEDRWLESGAYPNDAWIEIENPSEQIPERNYDFDRFPNLEIFEDIDLYSDENEAVYLVWADNSGRIELGVASIETYDDPDQDETVATDGSDKYTDQSADIERILGEVVEGVDDVSENISDEYAEILRNS